MIGLIASSISFLIHQFFLPLGHGADDMSAGFDSVQHVVPGVDTAVAVDKGTGHDHQVVGTLRDIGKNREDRNVE